MFCLFRKKKVIDPPLTADEIRTHLRKLFVENYFSMQESVLEVFCIKDFFEGDWSDSEFAAKVCVEYSVLLFELSVALIAFSDNSNKPSQLDCYNHLYRAHLVSTQDAASVLSITLEDKEKYFSDESHFETVNSYYSGVMSKKIVPLHFGSFRPFAETSALKKVCNDLFNIFANHLIYFLFTDDYFINSEPPLPLISPLEVLSMSNSFDTLADFAADFLKESTKFLRVD